MDIFVNGERETSQPCTIAELVARKGLLTDGLVVELNQRIVRHEQWGRRSGSRRTMRSSCSVLWEEAETWKKIRCNWGV